MINEPKSLKFNSTELTHSKKKKNSMAELTEAAAPIHNTPAANSVPGAQAAKPQTQVLVIFWQKGDSPRI